MSISLPALYQGHRFVLRLVQLKHPWAQNKTDSVRSVVHHGAQGRNCAKNHAISLVQVQHVCTFSAAATGDSHISNVCKGQHCR